MSRLYQIKTVICGGEPAIKFLCPGCRVWGYVDDDQYRGHVSILCDCGFHETIDLERQAVLVEKAREDA